MQFGNWIPISKGFTRFLPHGRAYTELEAAYSLQCDYDKGSNVTLSGYASLWRWGTDRVKRFLSDIGLEIRYPQDTGKKQRQQGKLALSNQDEIRMKSGCNQYEISRKRFIDSKWLDDESVRCQDESSMKPVRTPLATSNPNPDPDLFPDKSDQKAKKQPSRKRKTSLPENFTLPERLIEYARQQGINGNLDSLVEDFRDYHQKHGSIFVDWDAAFRTWIRKHIEFQKDKTKTFRPAEPAMQPTLTAEEIERRKKAI